MPPGIIRVARRIPTVPEFARIALTLIGTLVGAGFASGQELLLFFLSYGRNWVGGIAVMTLLFTLLGYALLTLSYKRQLTDYDSLLHHLFNKRLATFLEYIILLLFFSVLAVMLAALRAALAAACGDSAAQYGQLAATLLIGIAALGRAARLRRLTLYTAPLLLLALPLVCISSLLHHSYNIALAPLASYPRLQPVAHWLPSCVLYVAYNIMLCSNIFIPLGRSITRPAVRLSGCLLAGLVLAALSFCIAATVAAHAPDIVTAQLPLLTVACQQHLCHKGLFIAAFLAAVFTTASACLYGCAGKLRRSTGCPYRVCVLLTLAAALLLAGLDFNLLITALFPWYGYISAGILIRLLINLRKD